MSDPMGPVDPTAFNAARDAWYADRDRIIAEVLPKVDRAIAETESWATVMNNLVTLISQALPIIQSLAGTGTGAAASSSCPAGSPCPNAAGLSDSLKSVKSLLVRMAEL